MRVLGHRIGQWTLFAVMLIPGACEGAITWNVTFEDVVNSTNVGFDDPVLGATRRATFLSAFDYLNTILDENGSADILVKASQTDGSGFLAAAGPYFFTSPFGFQNGFVFEHATTGMDPSGSVPDATITFDFGYTWNSETDDPTGSEFDLLTVALHEITHTLGFLSLVDKDGNSLLGGMNPGVFSVYDSFLERGDGTKLFSAGGNFDGSSADLTSNNVFFGGPNAEAANGGNAVKVYAPNTFAPGSSISHIQLGIGEVMQYSVGKGIKRRAFTAQEVGILRDIGWTIAASSNPIPEPMSAVVWSVLAVAGLVVHRRRRRAEVDT